MRCFPLRHLIRCFSILLLISFSAQAQPGVFTEVKGIPTKQIYDLMIDRRGFLWIGHDLGLSRFDGNSITHFSCPEQNSLALSEILEDSHGRIWCRNFTSQIFYVENEKMHLLKAYEANKEAFYPRMSILRNKLVATSTKGLFVCNTDNMESEYISIDGFTTHLAIIRDKVLTFGSKNWVLFDILSNNTFTPLSFDPGEGMLKGHALQPHSFKDTIYSFSTRSGLITKFFLEGNAIYKVGESRTRGLMNTINPSGVTTWIHDKEQSKTVDGSEQISGYNLTDLVVDLQGNTWLSSFKYGLLVKYKNYWEKLFVPGIDANEVVFQYDQTATTSVFGTSTGRIVVKDILSGKIIRNFLLSPQVGPIEYIKAIDPATFIISTSLRIYMLRDDFSQIELVTPDFTLKNAVRGDSSIYLATSTGLWEVLVLPGKDSFIQREIKYLRCRWVEYDSISKTLLVAFKDGLSRMKDSTAIPVMYKGSQVAAITMLLHNGRFYISTFGRGILKMDGSGISELSILSKDKLQSVFKIKAWQDTIWLLGADFIESFDIGTEKALRSQVIPVFPDAVIYDLVRLNGQMVLLTSRGLFALRSTLPDTSYRLKNYLLKMSVNGRDTIGSAKLRLPHNKNSIEFFLSVPYFINPEKIYYKYRLIGSADESWQIGQSGESEFRFSSLQPGNYQFDAIAMHPFFGMAQDPIVVPFTIKPIWYESDLFKIGLALLVASVIVLFMRIVLEVRLRRQKIAFARRLAVEQERERISAEIHDDIGAGLSGVRLMVELTERKFTTQDVNQEIHKIHESIAELSTKMQEVIWSLNSGNDHLENLLQYIRKQAQKLFEHSPVKLEVTLPEEIPDVKIGSERRNDIYLSVKEGLHNALKHAGANVVQLVIRLENGILDIMVRDDGRGMHLAGNLGNGLNNMRKRIARLQGTMEIIDHHGVTLHFLIPL